MGSAAVCAKTKTKSTNKLSNEYETFSKHLDRYLKSERIKKLPTNIDKDKHSIINFDKNLENDYDSKDDIYEFKDNLVCQPKKVIDRIDEKKNFETFLKTGKLQSSNLSDCLNLDNLMKISLDLISNDQQAKIKNINHINIMNCVTFPRILNDIIFKNNLQGFETTEISEKTNFRIIYNKSMQDIMNNLFFPEEYKMHQRNTINFTMNSISFRDLPVPVTQLNVTTSNINGGQQIMEISNLNNLNFNTQPNDDFILKRRASNFTNFNQKIKNYYLEADKISSHNEDLSSNNIGSIYVKNKDSIASKTLKQLYDKVFLRNSFKSNNNQSRMSQRNSNALNFSYRKSISPNKDTIKKTSVFSKNKSFGNNYPKTALYTIEDCNYDDNNSSKIFKNFSTNPNLRKKNSEADDIKPNDKLARKLYYSLEVRAKILEKKEKEKELMMRSLSDLEEEYNHLQEEINPIFNIKNAIDDSEYNNQAEDSKKNINYLNTIERNNKNKSNKNCKKEPLFEINIKDLIKETINERIMTENNKDKTSDKSKIIKFKNLNINSININIQTNTEGNYSTLYKKKPKTYSNENIKENIFINASSEFINSIETLTNINNTNYDKKNLGKLNSLRKNDKSTNLKNINYSKKNLTGYSNKSLKKKYSNLSSSKKIDSSEAQKIRRETDETLNLVNNKKDQDHIKNIDLNKNRILKENKNGVNNCENIFSNIVIESPLLTNNKSIEDNDINKTASNINLDNLNSPSLTFPKRNSYQINMNEKNSLSTSDFNNNSINNGNIETENRDLNIDQKRAFTLKKYASNSLISESKSFTESDLVSSFDSKELATLQDESEENNVNLKFNHSKDNLDYDKYCNKINCKDNKVESINRKEYVSFNKDFNLGNINLNIKSNEALNSNDKKSDLTIQKRNTIIGNFPKFQISNFLF